MVDASLEKDGMKEWIAASVENQEKCFKKTGEEGWTNR